MFIDDDMMSLQNRLIDVEDCVADLQELIVVFFVGLNVNRDHVLALEICTGIRVYTCVCVQCC